MVTMTGHRADQARKCLALPCAIYRGTVGACRTSTQPAHTQHKQQSAKWPTDNHAATPPASAVPLPAISQEESPW